MIGKIYRRFAVEDMVMDGFLVAANVWLLPSMAVWFEQHFWGGFWLMGIAHLGAMVGAFLGGTMLTPLEDDVTGWEEAEVDIDKEGLTFYQRWVVWFDEQVLMLSGLIFVLALGSSLWLIFPRMIIEERYGKLPWVANGYEVGLIFGTILIFGAYLEYEDEMFGWWSSTVRRTVSAFMVGCYLLFSEAYIMAAMVVGGGLEEANLWAGVMMLLISYLPLRLVLLLRPPVRGIEMVMATAVFLSFLWRILGN